MLVKKFQEFLASFWAYLRPNEETGGYTDTRPSAALRMAQTTVDVLIEAYLDQPNDLAAVFSGCIGVTSIREANVLKGKKNKELTDALAGKPVLVAESGHPVEQTLKALLESQKGRRLYRDMALLLAEAQSDATTKPWLRKPGKEIT